MSVKELKLKLYRASAGSAERLGYIISVIITVGVGIFIYFYILEPGLLKIFLPSKILLFFSLGILVLSLLVLAVLSVWHFVTFRYIAYFGAWIISLIRRVLAKRIVIFIIIFLGVGLLQRVRICFIISEPEKSIFDVNAILQLPFLITTLSITLIIVLFTFLNKARKSIVISNFSNHTGREELEKPVEGIPYRVISEIIKLKNLYKSIDEMQPEAKPNDLDTTVSIMDTGKDLEEAVGTYSGIQVGTGVKVDLGILVKFMGWLTRGPKLCGCLQREGKKFVLFAWIRGGSLNGTWRVHSDDIENIEKKGRLLNSTTEMISYMIEDITYQMFTSMVNVGSPRWQAVKHYSNGLWQYRETVRTEENHYLTLRKAKTEFKKALAQDNKFAQCYYNLGIIYKKLGNNKAAEAAFRAALKENPDDFNSFYELARGYSEGKEKNFKDARWFCQQVMYIQPDNPQAWNLFAFIRYDRWKSDKKNQYKYKGKLTFSKEIIKPAMIAAMLSWRELCRARAKNNITPRHKNLARISIRNLSVLKGMKRPFKRWLSPFRQALFLSPEADDLYFELGKYYYRWEERRKARDAFFRVYEDGVEIDEPLRYWSCYADVNAHLFKEKGEEQFKETVAEGFTHFLDTAADILHDNKKDIQNELKHPRFEENIKALNSALDIIEKEDPQASEDAGNQEKNESISELDRKEKKMEFVSAFKDILEQPDKKQNFNKLEGLYNIAHQSKKYQNWLFAQLNIAVGKRYLELSDTLELPKLEKLDEKLNCALDIKESVSPGIVLLEKAREELEKNYPRQITKLRLHMYLAQGYLKLEQLDKSLFHAREAVRLNPFEPEERRLLGRVHIALENYNKAITELEISFRLQPNNHEILKELGEAYKQRGEKACQPVEMKEAFRKGRGIFTHALEIMGSHSFRDDEPADEEAGKNDDKYIENLGLIHYYLGYFCYELLEYDAAATHSLAAAQMGYKPVSAMIQAGWDYINAGVFYRAKQAFDKAGYLADNSKPGDRSGINQIEIKIGQAVACIEGVVSIPGENDKKAKKKSAAGQEGFKNIQPELDTICEKLQLVQGVLEEDLEKLDSMMKDVKKEENMEIPTQWVIVGIDRQLESLARLWSNYYECRGLMSYKKWNYEEALREFEQAVTYMGNARIYFRMAETHRMCAAGNDNPERRSHILNARNACDLCRKHDLREKYGKEIKSLLLELDTLEK
jgi:tetratricopeptide (TPR) repeat protein